VSRHIFKGYFGRLASIGCLSLALVGCEELEGFGKANPKPGADTAPAAATKFIEKDVEAPEVFQKTSKALWDGRPSLGGVWVAHPDNTKPERVIIRNKANGKFVIGALFNRERSLPGPPFQLSSDAAVAIGATAGTTLDISVTAMRVEKIAIEKKGAPKPAPSEDIASTALKALDDTKPTTSVAPTTAPKPSAAPVAKPSTTGGKYIQLGLFSVQANAQQRPAQTKRKY